jgi:hypothetical protein
MELGLIKVEPKMNKMLRWRCLFAALTGALTFAALTCSALPRLQAVSFAGSVSMNVEAVEVRSGTWNGAADGIIAKLKEAGVKRGQIVTIDAHNNGPDEDAIFSAHFVRGWPSKGDLDIQYTVQNTADYGWATFYNNAVRGVDTTDLIGITASCNTGGGGVQYVFNYAPTAQNHVVDNLAWQESRAGSWNGAADDIIAKLKANGVQRGQVVSIDAHNNGAGNGDNAIFSAFYDTGLPGYGELNIAYNVQNTNYGWSTFYANAGAAATTDVISITSSVNENGRAVTYVFNYS